MSWEDLKKKYNYKSDNSTSRENQSSWERIKNKYSQMETTSLPSTNTSSAQSTSKNSKTSLWDSIKKWATNDGKYIAKKTGAGIASGTAGIAQGQLTDIADNFRKGEDKSGIELTTNLLKSLTSIGNPSAKLTKATPEQIKKVLGTAFDKDKSSVEKATGLITSAVSDAMNNSSDVSDAMLNIAGKINNNLDEKTLAINDAISAPINKMNQKLEEEGQNYGAVTNLLADAGQGLGNMAPSLAAYAITKNPNISLGTMALSVKGQATQEALDRGAELEEAVKIGDTKALIEVGTEKLFGGINIFGKGTFDDLIEKSVLDKVKNNVVKFLVKQGIDGGSEVVEELISDTLGTVIDKGTVDPDAKYFENLGETTLTTLLTTYMLKAITGGYVNDINQIKNDGLYKDYYTKETLNDNSQKWLKEAESIIKENNTSNLQQNSINNQNNIDSQQVTQKQQKDAQNGISEQGNYQYIKTDNDKINNLREDMSKYWNNSQQTVNLGNTIEKIITDKNYNVRLDDTITNKDGKSVNAQIKTLDNGEIEIRLNPNAKNTGEFLIMHETTHAIGTQEMKSLVMDYASKNSEFNQALESLKQTYGVEDVSDEVLSDISGQLFGNQEFINNLSTEKPNVFKRIYNKIIELANKITGNSNEALFVRNLKNKWEEAYRTQNNNLNGNTYFSEIYNKDGSFDRVKIQENIFENSQGQSIKKAIKDYLTQHIGEYYSIIESGQKVYLGEELPNEYAYSEYSKKLPTNKLLAKGRASSNLQEIIENASNRQWSKNTKSKHNQDAKYGFYKYDTKFSFDVNGKEQIYSGTILIRNDANGKKYLYDILNIKKIGNNLPSVASDLNKPSYRDGSNSLPINSISPTTEIVNSNTNKKSMHKSENYSLPTKEWTDYLNKNFKATGTRTNLQDIKLPIGENVQTASNTQTYRKKTLNPAEISNLKPSDASTTPKLSKRKYQKGNKESSFYSNVTEDAKFLNEDLREEFSKEENVQYYKSITNQETLEKAFESLQEDGEKGTLNWFNKNSNNVNAEDVAKGWILLKHYQDAGDYQSAVEIAKKMREMATSAGQAVQAYNILARLTPEGMYYYAQSELSEAYNKMVEGKSKKWIEENQDKFNLTQEETLFIKETMNKVANMEDGYDKKVELAKIQSMLMEKIPPTAGQSIKAWMRISMLFNPKTQVRNVAGNAVVIPVNIAGDFIASGIDKVISKKTGVRTTGNINIKNYGKGFKKGIYESYNDFRNGINTRNIEGNRFEVSEGKSFKDEGIGKALNAVDSALSFVLDAGDRGFYEATFINSINNQMVLNNVTEPTLDMIEIATNEALQRTWQDNNNYTEAVLKIRNILNMANIKGYGLGDVIIPFAKTPANLTKAIVDYSPVGLVKAITLDAKTFKNSLENGQYTPQLQHKLVQNIGKGMAGTFLYVLGYALAKAGIATGEADDDKDVKNFMKNSLGISSYSIKIGDKTFTYDWAQPIATPLAIMTNYVKYSEENPDASIIDKAIKALNIGTEQLLEQSFMESLNTVLNGNGTTLENLTQAILELPARAVPTLFKQIADVIDGTQRTTFEYDKPIQSAVNSVVAKLPVASKSLPIARDTLGNEIKKYGGENNWFNVFFNPSNVNKGELDKAGEEIYRLYQETGETSIFPITAPYYINSNGEKITMTSEERSEYQKITGNYAQKSIKELLSNKNYKSLSDEKKADLISTIISDSNAKAKYEILGIESDDARKRRELIEQISTKDYYDYKLQTDGIEGKNATLKKNKILLNSNYSSTNKSILYENTTGKEDSLYQTLKTLDNDYKLINEYLKYKVQGFTSDYEDDGTVDGKAVYGSKEAKIRDYIDNSSFSYEQALIIIGTQYKLNYSERNKLYYLVDNNRKLTLKQKLEMYDTFKGFTVYKNGSVGY